MYTAEAQRLFSVKLSLDNPLAEILGYNIGGAK